MSFTVMRHIVLFAAMLFVACAPPAATSKLDEKNMNDNLPANRNVPDATPSPRELGGDDTNAKLANRDDKSPNTLAATEDIPGVELVAEISVVPARYDERLRAQIGKGLRVEYKVTNRSGKPILIFNQGDTNNPGPEGAVYVESKADGIVEISERGWLPPGEPSPTFLVYPGALLLAPGKTTQKRLEFTVDYLVARRPYGSMTPGVAMPRPIKRVRYCLGVVPAEGIETRSEGEGDRRILVPDYKAIVTQRLLCSAVQDIE